MRGFVEHGATGFTQQLREMEQAGRLAWPSVRNIECSKFGTEIIPGPAGMTCYSAVTQKGFFSLQKSQDYTRIDPILRNLDPNALTVIVTDLFEDDADFGPVFQSFKDCVFKRKLAVGIVGMKVGFNGTIYDIGTEKGVRQWSHDRPFYALVIGRVEDVQSYFAELTPRVVPANQLLILSDTLLVRPVSWDTSGKSRFVGATVDSNFISVARDSSSFAVLRLQTYDKCELDLKLDTKPNPFQPSLKWAQVQPELIVKRFPKSGGSPETVSFPENSVAAKILIGKGGDVGLHLVWVPKVINPVERTFAEQITLQFRAEDVDFSMFQFVHEWDAIPIAGSAATFDGGKTQYLSEFIAGLWKSLVQVERPDLGAIYVYFQSKR
jgi:hypothetical protein